MIWTASDDLRAQVMRLWDRGELLRSLVSGEPSWPRQLRLKGPTSVDLTDRFDAVRRWIAEMGAMNHIRVEWRSVNHRVQGAQSVPDRVWIDSVDDALALIGKRREAQGFLRLWETTRIELPALLPWLLRKPVQGLEHGSVWPRLLAVVRWVMDHPRPGIYLRQVDAPGVDSKFIESYRDVLSELLDLVLPPEVIDRQAAGPARFARRYGFLEKPIRVRFRVLDPAVQVIPGHSAHPDITLDAASFAALDLPVRQVFVTENETNFLAFPAAPDAIVLFGCGYGWTALADADWLFRRVIRYWGDIDTNGFAILDQLRSRFPHVSSFLMDRETLQAHEAHWGQEPTQKSHDLHRLTPEERTLYDDLRDNRIRNQLRLEQERIGFPWLTRALQAMPEHAGSP